MREIKFRGINKEENGFVYGYLVKMFGLKSIMKYDDENTVYIVNSETIGQYTGLKDCNGVEIYEDDIVRYFEGEFCQGCYQNEGKIIVDFSLKSLNDLYNSQNLEVIGNIHQNKELLGD